MSFWSRWGTFLKSPLVRTILAAGLGTGVSAWIGLFKDLPSWVTWLYEQLVERTAAGQVSPTRWGAVVIDGCFVLLVLGIAAAGFYGPTIWAAQVERLKQATHESVQRCFLDPAAALYSAHVRTTPHVRYSALEWEMRIEPNYDGTTFQRWTWAADDQIVYVRNIERACTVPAEGLECIALSASVLEGVGTVAAIPAADEPYRKNFLLFPIPPLRPGEATRRVEVSGKWPKAFAQLAKPDVWDYHTFTLPAGAVGPIDSLKIRITFPSDRHFEVVEDFQPTSREFDGAVYEAELVNAHHGTRIALRIRRLP